MVTKIKIK